MRVLELVLVGFVFLCVNPASAEVSNRTVQLDSFYEGAEWIWAYSELDEKTGGWKEPYLFETYKLVERAGDLVTIEMSSTNQLRSVKKPHHKFVANLRDCIQLGESLRGFYGYRIAFYTKSLSDSWELLSRRFKALAFTEKFNCFSGRLKSEERVYSTGTVFKWRGLQSIHSWYHQSEDSSDLLNGVAILRQTKNYKMELVRVN